MNEQNVDVLHAAPGDAHGDADPARASGAVAEGDLFVLGGAGAIERVVPTTEAQREIWLADRLGDEASLAYNESASLHLAGSLDRTALAAALRALGERHEALRCTVGTDGTELWVHAGAPLEARSVDLEALDDAGREALLHAERAHAVETRFDLDQGPLVRAVLMRSSAQRHELMLTAHHIVCDGWSLGVLADELVSLYRAFAAGEPSFLPPAPRYSDYALAQRGADALARQSDDERWWLQRFADAIPPLDLPGDRPRPAGQRSFASRREELVIDATLTAAIKRLGAAQNASLFATLFSIYGALLARLAGTDDLVVGVPSAGQPAAGEPGLVGHCVNLLPIRLGVAIDAPAAQHIAATRALVLDATEHRDATFGSLLKKMPIERDPARLPLVSVLFNLDAELSSAALSDERLRVSVTGNPRHAENFELFLNVAQAEGGLRLECQYNCGLFDASTVQRWLALYRTALERCVAEPRISLAEAFAPTATERTLLDAFNATDLVHDRRLRIDDLIGAQAAATPEAVAVVAGTTRLTYAQLDAQANALASELQRLGVRPGELVGLSCGRNGWMLAGLLGILKSGAGYVPLDPALPQQRLEFMAQDAALRFVATDAGVASAWPFQAAQPVAVDALAPTSVAPPRAGSADDVAYVIYTSGSTGVPKGVRVPHRSVVNLLASLRTTPGMTSAHRVLSVTTLSFDIAVSEVIMPLTVGARIVVADRAHATDGDRLRDLLDREDVDFVDATPSTWRLLLAAGWPGRADLLAICTGEPLPPDLARELLPRVRELWNGYGPTETTVWSSFHRVTSGEGTMPIGHPIANTQIHVADAQRRPLPLGAIGELFIAGEGVTLGYLNRPELTAERFVPGFGDSTATWYRTGDLGRWRADGTLECLGRIDHQVKVRGFRIELGEIEATLGRHPSVERALVVTREDEPGDVRIVAYLVARGSAMDPLELRRHVAAALPDYMIPQHFVRLDAFPLLSNGKLDRRSLPRPNAGASATRRAEHVAPRNELERAVLETMESVLNLPGLGVADNFFQLGGHSLLAMRLAARLNAQFDVSLKLRALFESATAETLARAIEVERASGAPGRRAPIAHDPARQQSAPLTLMQERVQFLEELQPGRVVFNTPSGHRLKGPMDRARFELALREIVRRQPSLRTRIARTPEGRVEQRIDATVAFTLPFEDLGDLPAPTREEALMARMQAVVDTPIAIDAAPLFRVALYRLADDEHAFLFMPHHIVWDGWSFDLFYAEIAAVYGALLEDKPIALAPPAITYADYARWLAAWLAGPDAARQLQFWKQRFADAPAPRQPATDLPRGANMSGEGLTEWVRFDREATEALREVARGHGLTLSMLAMSVYAAMMAAAIGTPHIVVGLPVRGRLAPETEGVMGFFNNLLPVQFQVDPTSTFSAYLQGIKRDMLDVFEHQEIPFERLASEPEISSRAQKFGLYQALFSFQDARERQRAWGPLTQQSILLFQKGATEDLGLWLMEVPGGLEGGFTYNRDIYLPETAVAFRERYGELMQRVIAEPGVALADLMATGSSAAARRLQRLAGDAGVPPVAAPTPAAAPGVSTAQALATFASDHERTLAQIWSELLELAVGSISARDNFFDLGGNSLLAMRAVETSGRMLGFRIDARRYFYESLAQLANEEAASANTTAQAKAEQEQDNGGLLKRVFKVFGGKARK